MLPANPGTKRYLQEQAQSLDMKGISSMRKPDLARALSEKLLEIGGRRVPGRRAEIQAEPSPADAQVAEVAPQTVGPGMDRLLAALKMGSAQVEAPAEQTAPDDMQMSDFDRLVAASQEDPALADLLRQAVMARLGGEQLGPLPNAPEQQVAARRADPMAGMLRNLAVR